MFSLGVTGYPVGGLMIELGVSMVYILTGLHAAQSSFFSAHKLFSS